MTTLRQERDTFGRYVLAVFPRARILSDEEGWPISPGKYGCLEWRGPEWNKEPDRIYAYTSSAHVLTRLQKAVGSHPWQIGEGEGTVWLHASDQEALRAAGTLLRLRYRRAPGTGPTEAQILKMREGLARKATRGHAQEGTSGSI